MKKNTPYLIFLFLLIALLGYLYFTQKSSTIEDANFRLESIKDVAKIELEDKKGMKMTLVKKGKTWFVNGTFPAENSKVIFLLEALNKFEVEAPVSGNQRNLAINDLRTMSIKVSISNAQNEVIKTIHIGNSASEFGNYMIEEHDGIVSPNPYVVKLPGYEGNLKYKFLIDTLQWKSTSIFATELDKIAQISVEYQDHPKTNFVLTKYEEIIKITPIHDSLKIKKNLNKSNVINFLLEFEKMHFEAFVDQDTIIQTIQKSPKYATISLKDVFGHESKIVLYHKAANPNKPQFDVKNQPIPNDIERYWGYIPSNNTYVLAQYFVFGPVLRNYAYFFEEAK